MKVSQIATICHYAYFAQYKPSTLFFLLFSHAKSHIDNELSSIQSFLRVVIFLQSQETQNNLFLNFQYEILGKTDTKPPHMTSPLRHDALANTFPYFGISSNFNVHPVGKSSGTIARARLVYIPQSQKGGHDSFALESIHFLSFAKYLPLTLFEDTRPTNVKRDRGRRRPRLRSRVTSHALCDALPKRLR